MKVRKILSGVCAVLALSSVALTVGVTSAQAVCPSPWVNPYLSTDQHTVVQPSGSCTRGHAVRAMKRFYLSDNTAATAVSYGTWERAQFPTSVAVLPYGYHKSHHYRLNY